MYYIAQLPKMDIPLIINNRCNPYTCTSTINLLFYHQPLSLLPSTSLSSTINPSLFYHQPLSSTINLSLFYHQPLPLLPSTSLFNHQPLSSTINLLSSTINLSLLLSTSLFSYQPLSLSHSYNGPLCRVPHRTD